ncbi:MAG TPA: YoaK family protein [Streptosporangiaceae bacterium]
MADDAEQRTLLYALMALTLVSGVVDAVSYLALGRVFTANMTGNVVVLGFAAAGAPGFSVPATLTSLGVFLVGAVTGGRLAGLVASKRRLLIAAIAAETLLVGTAAAIGYLAGTVSAGWGRYTTIAILALAMGMRNAVVRHLAVPDVTTTVLTQTLTGLAADSRLAGGTSPRTGRRATAVVAMALGAFAGAALFLHQGAGPALVLAAGVSLAALTWYVLAGRATAGERPV